MENKVMNTYSRFNLVLESGHGPWVTDENGVEKLPVTYNLADSKIKILVNFVSE